MASFVAYMLRTNMSITGKSMMADPDIGHGPGTRDNPRIDNYHLDHAHRTAIFYGRRASTVVSGGLWWSDWKLVSGLWMGIS